MWPIASRRPVLLARWPNLGIIGPCELVRDREIASRRCRACHETPPLPGPIARTDAMRASKAGDLQAGFRRPLRPDPRPQLSRAREIAAQPGITGDAGLEATPYANEFLTLHTHER